MNINWLLKNKETGKYIASVVKDTVLETSYIELAQKFSSNAAFLVRDNLSPTQEFYKSKYQPVTENFELMVTKYNKK